MHDFVDLVRRILPDLLEKNIRVVANAGGVNPGACLKAVSAVAREGGASGIKVGMVMGDDILDRLDAILAEGVDLANMGRWTPADGDQG